MENERSSLTSMSAGSYAEPSMYDVNLPSPRDLGEAIKRVFAREHLILRRPGAFRTYVVGATFAVHLIDGGAPADLDGALLVSLRGLDDEERFAAVVYISDHENHAVAHVEFRGRQPTSVYRAECAANRRLGEFVRVGDVDDRVVVDAGAR